MKKIIQLLLISLTFVSCVNNPQNPNGLTLISKRSINIPEISGLTTNFRNTLFAISDNNGKFYSLDTLGNLLDSAKLTDGDFEAITFTGNGFAAAEEKTAKIYLFDYYGNIIDILNTDITVEVKNGLEGLIYIPQDSIFIAATEKNPVALHKINMEGKVIDSQEFFSSKDISGLWFEEENDYLWILSEESTKIMKCNLNYEVLGEYQIPDDKIEGICVTGEDLYLVSDDSHNFYHYKISGR